MRHKSVIILSIIFVFVLVLRLIVAFQTSELTYDGYFVLRNVDSILSSGVPLFQDDLSFSGRSNAFSPLYYYVLALFSVFFSPLVVLKVLPNIFASSIVFVVFLFSMRLSKNDTASLIAAGSAGIIPVFFVHTLNNASVYSLVIPLFFLCLYFFLRTVNDSKNLWKFILCSLLLSLTHASSLILLLGLLFYVVLLNIQGFKKSVKESELLLFSLFLIIWTNLIIYSRAINLHGSSVIYQNAPVQLILDFFKEITFVESLYWIGVIPLLFGIITIYNSVFSSKNKRVASLISVCLVFFLLLWFRLINLYVGLMFLGVTMSILSSETISKALVWGKNLKFKHTNFFLISFLILLMVSSFIPSIGASFEESSRGPSERDLEAFSWIKQNTPENSTVLAFPEEGFVLSYYSGRQNVIDENFLLVQNIDVRYDDVHRIYNDRFLIPALSKLNYYSVDYILLSEFVMNKGVSKLFYEDDDCVKRVYDPYGDGPFVYSVNCVVRG